MNKQLNASCDFLGYLVCQMHKDVVEVELKVKTKWGKYTLIKISILGQKSIIQGTGQTAGQEFMLEEVEEHPIMIIPMMKCKNPISMSTSTDSGTYIPTGKGWGIPLKFLIILKLQKL